METLTPQHTGPSDVDAVRTKLFEEIWPIITTAYSGGYIECEQGMKQEGRPVFAEKLRMAIAKHVK